MNTEPFIEWTLERESIRIKKERGDPWPWTTDPILQQFRFCCPRREDDRVTKWIKANIREPYADHPYLFWMLAAARTINWPDTLQELIATGAWPKGKAFNPAVISTMLQRRKDRGDKVYTGSYMIKAESAPSVPWFTWSKQKYIAEIVLGRLWEERKLIAPYFRTSLQAAHEILMTMRGWGPFMSYQCVVDARFCESLLANAPDRFTWAASGPGTLRGLNRLHERPFRQALSQEQALDELLELYPLLHKEIDIDFSDIPNICCETDKYLRVKNGEGRPRNLYRPA